MVDARGAQVAVLRGPRDLIFESRAVEELTEDSLYAETEVSAISIGTERAAYVGDPPLRPGPVYPRLVGYCNVATVRKSGSRVKGISVGDRILTHQSHRSAFSCKAEAVIAVVPDRVSSRDASVVYLGQLGMAALQAANFRAGETVAVIGLGPIGLATVALAAAAGGRVAAIGNHANRISLGRRFGCQSVVDASAPGHVQALLSEMRLDGVDVVVTTANAWTAWQDALALPRKHGRIAVLGFPGRNEGPPPFHPLASQYFYDKQLTIVGAGQSTADPHRIADDDTLMRSNIGWMLERMANDRLPLGELVTHEEPWQRLGELYERSLSDKSIITAVLRWRENMGA